MNLLFKFSIVLLLSCGLNCFAQDNSIEDLLNRVEGTNKPSSKKNCLPNAKIKTPVPPVTTVSSIFEDQVIKDTAGVDFKISVVTPEKATQLFKDVKVNDLALREGNSLCKERAQVIGAELEREGIQTGKVFALPTYFGSLYPNPKDLAGAASGWKFHVANTILVKNGDKTETWVLDPFLFNKPVPLAEWEKKLKSHPDSSYSKTQLTNRYVYDPKQIGSAKSKYEPRELMQARERLQGRR